MNQDQVEWALGNPETAQIMLNKLDAEESLLDYITMMWSILEPGRKFVSGRCVDALCDHLEAVTRGDIKRLVMNVPPGMMKSLTTDVFWPSWEWGPKDMPWVRYVAASYSEALTIRDNRRTRSLLNSPLYQQCWGDRFHIVADQNAKVKFENNHRGFKIATSVSGLGTGERGDRFIIDDPHNIKDGESEAKRDAALQWFTEVVPTRINDPEESAIIVIMQRVHESDVSGLILKEELNYEWLCLPMEYEEGNRSFTTVPTNFSKPETVCRLHIEGEPLPRWVTKEEYQLENVPEDHVPKWQSLYCQDWRTEEEELLWPDRFSPRYLEEELKPSLRAWGGEYAAAGQLQQRPAPRGGGMFQKEDWCFLAEEPQGWYVRGWDLAGTKKKKSAFTVGVKIGISDGRVVISDVRRFRETPGGVERRVLATTTADGRGVLQSFPQDPGQAGLAQKAAFAKMLHGFNFHFSAETGEKPDRAKPLAAQCEAGNVYLVRAPWNDPFINELSVFPASDFKDQADGASRGYDRLIRRRAEQVGAAPQVLGG